MYDLDRAVHELTEGSGYCLFEDLFPADAVRETRELIVALSDADAPKLTHFHGEHADRVDRQRRVWNLLNKGRLFEAMVQPEPVMELFARLLGCDFILGSFAANRLLPGAPGQEPHVDYPYWDLHDRGRFPLGINGSFLLNCQMTIMLDDFTAENGATACVPGSQREVRYPTREEFEARKIQVEGRAGSAMVFNGLMWHCAMPNNSKADRSALLGQYLPKFVKPMEDQVRGVHPDVVARASPRLRQLIGIDLKYPQLLDEAEAVVDQGRYAART
ncbi:MAG TPA: phytanoyl-CoA dioxygenase family protein [Alphaproteobacteria bacterium]|nr:phytanoyl-CoA dioxygenase family protein [Alphaproteobacteria bacterium]